METLFENTYVRDEKHVKEIYSYLLFKRTAAVVIHTFFAACLLINIFGCIITKSYVGALGVVFILTYFFAKLFSYNRSVRLTLMRDKETYDAAPVEVQTSVTNDTIKISVSNGSANEVPLSKFKKGVRTKSSIILYTEAKLIYIFPKDSFTKGTPEGFISFMQNKGIIIN